MPITTGRGRAAGTLLVLSGLVYFGCEAVSASAWTDPPYSYAHNYISDLGVPGPASVLMGRVISSPLAVVMNLGFVGHAVLFLVAVALLTPLVAGVRRNVLVALAVLHAVGITLVGLVHGSAYSIAHGLFVWHATGANLAIFAGNAFAIVVGAWGRRLSTPRWFAVASTALGIAGFLSLGLLALRTSVPDGIFERGAAYPLFLWDLVAGVAVLAGRSTSAPRTSSSPPAVAQAV